MLTNKMNIKNKLIQEIEESPDYLIHELLDFFLFIKNRQNQQPSKLRPYGLCKDEFVVPSDFDDPLPDEIIKDFE